MAQLIHPPRLLQGAAQPFEAMRIENRTLAGRLQELGDNVENLLGEKSRLPKDLKHTQDREAKLPDMSKLEGEIKAIDLKTPYSKPTWASRGLGG